MSKTEDYDDGPMSIHPAPGTCCPDMKVQEGVCQGCGTFHTPAWLEGKDFYRVRCRSLACRQDIVMIKIESSGRYHPFDLDGTSHFKTCIDANSFKKGSGPATHRDQRKLEVEP